MNTWSFDFGSAARQRTVEWLLNHKAAVTITLLLCYIFLWPKSSPPPKSAEVATPALATIAQTKPQAASQPSELKQMAGNLPLYDVESPGADPSWSLPAELKAEDVQKLFALVEALPGKWRAKIEMRERLNNNLQQLRWVGGSVQGGEVMELFWSRLRGEGFRDKKLPLDWYAAMDANSSWGKMLTEIAEVSGDYAVEFPVVIRLHTVKMRIIGGKVLTADMLFIKGLEALLDRRREQFEKALPATQELLKRVGQEFNIAVNIN